MGSSQRRHRVRSYIRMLERRRSFPIFPLNFLARKSILILCLSFLCTYVAASYVQIGTYMQLAEVIAVLQLEKWCHVFEMSTVYVRIPYSYQSTAWLVVFHAFLSPGRHLPSYLCVRVSS